jgi:hypothetical protein
MATNKSEEGHTLNRRENLDKEEIATDKAKYE